jgi:glycosyltransferase involved in cell wall biosynthesis
MEKVSVVTPTHNGLTTLPETIASVQAQTYPVIEHIIVDDGSDDEAFLQYLSSLPECIQVIHQENAGPAAARNRGVNVASGTYILLLDDDDLIDPTYIEKAAQILDRKEADIVYCQADRFGDVTCSWDLPSFSPVAMLVDNVVFITALFSKALWHSSAGGFDENMKKGLEDYDFWLTQLEHDARFYRIPEVLFHCRVKSHSHNTESASTEQKLLDNYSYLYQKHRALFLRYEEEYMAALRADWVHLRYILNKPAEPPSPPPPRGLRGYAKALLRRIIEGKGVNDHGKA